MGAWGSMAFENDTSLDWIATFEESRSNETLLTTFRRFLADPSGHDVGEEAFGAAEILAAALGRPSANEDTERVVREAGALDTPPTDEVIVAARAATALLLTDESNINALWLETGGDDYEAWANAVRDVAVRLAD